MADHKPGKPKADSPFAALKGLRKQLQNEELERKETARRQQVEKQAHKSDEELFRAAMAGVERIDQSRILPKKSKNPSPFGKDDDAEVLQELNDLVEGRIPLDFTFSDEFVEGRAMDCSRLELSKLREGDYAVQAHLDLHGKTRDEARPEIEAFFGDSMKRGFRCVLVIPGRGLRSPGGKPVLKELLVRWLAQGQLSRYVLAFCSAKAHDGGVGALYVLLRRRKVGDKP